MTSVVHTHYKRHVSLTRDTDRIQNRHPMIDKTTLKKHTSTRNAYSCKSLTLANAALKTSLLF
jgi:hypothetical protein